jgi:hypothetical protein
MTIKTNDLRWTLIAIVLMLVGCGGGDDAPGAPAASQGASNPPSASAPPAASDSLMLHGVPATAASIAAKYSFKPTVTNTSGSELTFEIANKPEWATFSPTTGQLQGTPTAADVGTTSNIVIQVSDGTEFTTLPVFSITVAGVSVGSATVRWMPPTQNTDGSPLTDLAGYRIYWGTAPDDFSNSTTIKTVGLTTYVVENLAPGRYYFAMTALNAAGRESELTAAASKTIT